jgi:hypothetical protein
VEIHLSKYILTTNGYNITGTHHRVLFTFQKKKSAEICDVSVNIFSGGTFPSGMNPLRFIYTLQLNSIANRKTRTNKVTNRTVAQSLLKLSQTTEIRQNIPLN